MLSLFIIYFSHLSQRKGLEWSTFTYCWSLQNLFLETAV